MTHSRRSTSKRSYTRLWATIYPDKWMDEFVTCHQLDRWAKKLLFKTFILFLLTCIILAPHHHTSRDLAAYSQQLKYQSLTHIPAVAHSSITARLNRIPPQLMDILLIRAHDYARDQSHRKSDCLPQLKVFDTTMWSVTAKHYHWAAKNGFRTAARFVFVMNAKTGLPERIIDASMSMSDNAVFKEVIGRTRPGTIWVFDRGYSRLSTLKRITERHCSFITRWGTSYSWRRTSRRKLDPYTLLTHGWHVIQDEIGWVGSIHNPGRAQYRRIVCQHEETGKTFIIFTNRRDESAGKLVRIYLLRWPIEVTFKHVKSSLGVIHFPVRSPEGVHNWLVLVALSLIFVDLLTSFPAHQPLGNLMRPQYPFRTYLRQTQILLENEIIQDLFHRVIAFVQSNNTSAVFPLIIEQFIPSQVTV